MTDEQITKPVAFLQVFEQVDDLDLHRQIKRGGWFIENQQLRAENQGSGQGDALALTT